jgi:hypothetical protein
MKAYFVLNEHEMNSELTYSTRREIREELQRQEAEGVSLDPAVKCICPNCNQVHYRSKQGRFERPSEVENG